MLRINVSDGARRHHVNFHRDIELIRGGVAHSTNSVNVASDTVRLVLEVCMSALTCQAMRCCGDRVHPLQARGLFDVKLFQPRYSRSSAAL
jgi:hypothetical protein